MTAEGMSGEPGQWYFCSAVSQVQRFMDKSKVVRTAEKSRVISTLPFHFPDSLSCSIWSRQTRTVGAGPSSAALYASCRHRQVKTNHPQLLSPALDSVIKSNCCPVQTENCSVSASKSADSWVSIFLLKQPKKSWVCGESLWVMTQKNLYMLSDLIWQRPSAFRPEEMAP